MRSYIRSDLGLGEIIGSIIEDVEAIRVVFAWLNRHNVALVYGDGAWRIGRVAGETRKDEDLPAFPTLAQAMEEALDYTGAKLAARKAQPKDGDL